VTRIARDEPDMSVIIDCAHGNSQKSAERQEAVFLSALEQRGEGLPNLVGVMLESYLSHGSQFLVESPTALRSGVSITDPCIDWATTERLISLSALSTLTKR
jgi:3-deoxy-7-phosphoheptulonate synthase